MTDTPQIRCKSCGALIDPLVGEDIAEAYLYWYKRAHELEAEVMNLRLQANAADKTKR
jgi:hypothetical protein